MAKNDFLSGIELVERLNKEFTKHKDLINVTADAIGKLQGEYKKLPSDYLKIQREIQATLKSQAQAEAALTRTKQESEKLTQQQIRTEKARIQLSQQQTRSKEAEAKAEARANIELQKAQNLYNKVQAKVNGLIGTYNNLATKRELGLKLNIREEAQLLSLEKRLNKYQDVLKKVDAGIGKYTRNVGNYASGNTQLNMAVGQFARELPNAGISFQTFVMSLSNQFGQLQDAIAQTVAQNKVLIAQGQPVKSVGAQILGSFLSLNTALYVGIAFFTAYNEEIADFFKELFSGKTALDAVKESQDQLNSIRNESAKSIVDEKLQLQGWLATAKDVNLSYKEREIAANNILKQYPFWFENLGKEAILNGNVEKAVKGVNDALLARAKANAAVGKITENQGKIIDLEEELRLEKEVLKTSEKSLERYQYEAKLKAGTSTKESTDLNITGKLQQATANVAESKRRVAEIQGQINGLNDVNNRLTNYSIQQTKEQIGLDYQVTEGKKMQTEALKDYIASQYELLKLRLENEASIQQRVFEDEELNYERRAQAAQQYGVILNELAQMRLNESLRVLESEKNQEIAQIKDRIKNKEITERNGNAVIFTIQKQYQYDSLKAYEEYAEDLRQNDIAITNSMKGVWDKIDSANRQRIISETDLRLTQDYVQELQNMNKANKDYREVEKAAKQFAIANRDISRAQIQNEIIDIEKQLEAITDTSDGVQKRIELTDQLAQKNKQLADINKQEADEQQAAIEKLQKATESYLQSFQSTALDDFGLKSLNTFMKVEENGKTMFENLMKGADTAAEKFAVAFNSITEVAQEAYAFINQSQQKQFDAQYARLEREKEISLRFADDSETGRAEIEAQYEEKRRQIKIREWKANKEAAIFNAVINTAQAVTSALPNYALALIVGALGAAQIAMISAQQIPAYAEGTEGHHGGAMLVNDGRHREVIVTPDGNVQRPTGRNVLMTAPKGTKVFPSEKAFQSELDAMLMANDIAPFSDVLHRNRFGGINITNGFDLNGMEQVMDRVMKKHAPKSNVNVEIGKRGIAAYTTGVNTRNIIHNNSIKFKSNKI